ncbi:hypothetical protein CMO89_02110 [Candidatus Woesearchaeota archaeon]|nr:hypothetical protein [Candidatus Woesearchaeota archaeon]|tara:strand:- start:11101 stop:12594 length:1494 start_codon:yes stop_codon:yes gene_type:complete
MKKIQNINSISENLIYKKTVYALGIKCNEENLTKEGYFDLKRISNLRVLDNGFLRTIRNRSNKTQRELSNLIGVPLRTWIGWESYSKSLPFDKLILLINKLNIDKVELYKMIKSTKFTYGKHHGKNRLKIPIDPSKFELVNYLIPISHDRAYLVKDTPQKIKDYVLSDFSIDKNYFKKSGLIVIYSYLLNKLLKTFYIYERKTFLRFPLSNEVKSLVKLGVNLEKSVIVPLLLSDGGEKSNNRLFFSGASEVLHKIWADALFFQYGLLPSSFLLKYKSIFITTHNFSDKVLSKIKETCPTFKTSPINETTKEYLNKPQPSINYLFERPNIEQQTTIRLWANTEGSIGIALDKKTNLITPSLKIACAHPSLIKELQYLCKINKLNMLVIKEDKNWSGLSALRSNSIETAINFLKIGGFIRSTRISMRSEYFNGLDKQDVLLGILELIIRQRKNKTYRTKDINKIYKDIRIFVINKKFKDEEHYINIFKNFNNWSIRVK